MFIPDSARLLAEAVPREGFRWTEDGPLIVDILQATEKHLRSQNVTVSPELLTGILLSLADQYGWDAPRMGPGTEAMFYSFIAANH